MKLTLNGNSFLMILVLSMEVFVTTGNAQNNSTLKLWYNKPSGKVWENALPIGNGRLGAMIYGNVEKETIQLNEHTLWSGGPNHNDNPLALDSLGEIRKLILEGKQKQAEQLANRVIISKKSHGQMFEPAGELHLSFAGHENYTNLSNSSNKGCNHFSYCAQINNRLETNIFV